MRRVALLVLMLCLVLPAAAAADAPATRIVGGQDATRDYPWMAYLEIDLPGYGTVSCGGSLIAARYVLTAAHCVTSPAKQQLATEVNLALGVKQIEGDLTSAANKIPADHRFLHIPGSAVKREPSYDDALADYDAAVIQLPRPAPEEQLRLARATDDPLWAPGLGALATGWGYTSDGCCPADTLQEVTLPIATDTTCSSLFGPDYRPQTMLCAGDTSGKDTCNGDSGGPLMTTDHERFVLVGLTSWGGPCGRAAAVYTRVGNDAINAWIRSIVPQVELTQDVAQPAPGQEVTFTATATHPSGSYDHLDWDLDGDGAFDDASGVTTVKRVLSGTSSVSVRATKDSTGDAEVRTLTNTVSAPSPVGFDGGALTVTEGQPAVLTVLKSGAGAGTVVVTPHAESAGLATDVATTVPQTLTFGAAQASQTVVFQTVDDTVVEGPETFRVDLGGHTGDLMPATPGALTVTILDNDVAPPRPRVRLGAARTIRPRHGAFRIFATTNYGGHLRATAKDKAGHVLARALRRKVAPGRVSLKLVLTPRGREALRRHRRVRVTLAVVYRPPAGRSLVVKKRAYLR
jgi:secreted trypsin-like serine protease